jgi:hypothetical protein
MRNRNSTFIAKIGNSTLTVDEMTQSRILRVGSRATLNKPMYRDDIFYSGSLLRIPQYANNVRYYCFEPHEKILVCIQILIFIFRQVE